MKLFLFAILIVLPLFSFAQVVDTAAVRMEVDSLVKLSQKLSSERKFEEAFQVVENAKKQTISAFGKNHPLYAVCLNSHGRILMLQRRYTEVEPLYLEAKSILEKTVGKDHLDYGKNLISLANLYSQMKRYEVAESLYLEAKTVMEKNLGKGHLIYAGILYNLATLYKEILRYKEAEPLYLEAKSILEKTVGKEHPQYINTLNNLANLYIDMGRYETAETLYLEAQTIREKVFGKDNSDYALGITNLGLIYSKMGRYETAEALYLEAKTIREKVFGKEHPDYASSLEKLANLYISMGRYETAETLHLEAQTIREKVFGKESIEYAYSLNNLANLYTDTGRYETAESFYLEAKTILAKLQGKVNPDYAQSMDNLGRLYRMMGRYEIAESPLVESKIIWEKMAGKEYPKYASNLLNLADLYWKTNRLTEAEKYYLEASSIQNTLLLKATRHLSEQELASYSELFKNNLNQLYSFTQIQPRADSLLTAACFDQSLFYKGFLLTASNRIRHLATSDSIAQQQFEFLTSYNRRLAVEYTKPIAERQDVAELEAKANELEKELVRTVAGFGEALRRVNWKEVQQQLKPQEAAVEFVYYQIYNPDATDSILYAALVLRPGDQQPHFVPLFEEKQLNKLLPSDKGKQNNEFISKMYMKSASNKDSIGLYELIWKPLDSLLINTKTVYCAPSGLLHRINLSAIASDRNKTMADRFQIVQLGSTRSLVVSDGMTGDSKNDAMLFGGIQYELDTTVLKQDTLSENLVASLATVSFHNADRSVLMRGENWRFLPSTEKEVQQIQALLKQSKFSTKVYTGKTATEEVFKSIDKQPRSPRIIHLATHSFFFPDPKDTIHSQRLGLSEEPVFKISDHPLIRAGLLLAGGSYAWQHGKSFKLGQEDGILTAYEISQMNLSNTELVVLSACETGLGDIQGNEGVYGLQRAFKIAGAKYLIMSLWKVSDQHTAEMMTEFYHQWLQGGRTIREAFYGAQQKMREKYRFPHLWAGFVLIE